MRSGSGGSSPPRRTGSGCTCGVQPLTVDGLRHIKVRYWRTLFAIRRRDGNVTGPARRLTIWSRAGEDVGRSRMPLTPGSPYIAPEMPKA
jgi:hypothetical protein